MRFLRIFALIALCLAFAPAPALAVTGYDSAYSGESAFVTIDPGQTQNFQVFFSNTGTFTWTKGSATQVDLAACLEDKVTCNAQDPGEALWNSGWISTARYATTTQATVAPGSLGTFSYNIKAPSNATGTHRFNGDLVVASSGARVHPEGYYQDATVNAVGSVTLPTPTPGSTPFPSAPPVIDNEPPQLTLPSDITKTAAPGSSTAVVTYVVTATDNIGIRSTVCTPASGTAFTYGTTTVSCTTTDTSGNTARGTFKVRVNFAISGRITDRATGMPLAGATALVADAVTRDRIGTATSGADGTFSIVTSPGRYRVLFNGDSTVPYTREWWNRKTQFELADVVTVSGSVGGIDAALVPGVFVRGQVTDETTHLGIAGVQAGAFDPAAPCCQLLFAGSPTDAAGNYVLVVPAGTTAKIQFVPGLGIRYLGEWWDNKRSFETANVLTIASNTSNINAALTPGVLISGKVTDDQTGAGLGGIAVNITDSTTHCCPFGNIAFAGTAPDGTYQVLVPKGMPVKINFFPFGAGSDPRYIGEWFEDQPDWDRAKINTFTSDTMGIDAALTRGLYIRGHVTRRDGTPIAGLHANANDGLAPCCRFITGAQTDSNGDYAILVRPGTYKVLFFSRAPFLATDGVTYVDQWWDGAQFFDNGTQIVVNADVTGINAVMTRAVFITGHVTDTGAHPVAGLGVSAQDANQPCCHGFSGTQTDAAGAYRLIVPAGASVKVEFGVFDGTPPGSGLLGQWWNNKPSFDTADRIDAPADTSSIDARLATGFVVSGHVSEQGSGLALGGVHVQVIDSTVSCCPFRNVAGTQTDGSGNYSVVVAAGSYKVQFSEFPLPAHPHMQQWWQDKPFDQGADVLVVAGDRPGIDASLLPAVFIRGHVTDATGTIPISGVFASSPDATQQCCQFIQGGQTDDLGNYAYPVPLGSHVKVQFAPPPGTRYLGQWWNNKPDFASATEVIAAADQNNIDARLESAFVISGTVTGPAGPVANVFVNANVTACCQDPVGSAVTDANGHFQIAVRSGTYRIQANPQPSTHLLGQWWTGLAGGSPDFQGATDIVVGSSDVSGKDFTLVLGALIQGHVDEAGTGQPIGNIGVNANDAAAPCCRAISFTGTDPQGNYAMVVPLGQSVRMLFGVGPMSPYTAQWWDNKPSFDVANIIDTTIDQPHIDAHLARGVVISGRVTDGTGAIPIGGLQVSAQNAGAPCCQFMGGAQTDLSGNYHFTVPAGASVKVEFGVFGGPPPGTRYLGQWWNNATTFESATPISAVGDQPGIDAHLANGFLITGHVSERGSTGGLPDVQVQVVDSAVPCCPFRQVAFTRTNGSGDYSAVVPAGTYKVQFFEYPPPLHPHMQQWWNGHPFDQGADLLVVSGDRPSIDAALIPAVFVRGRVTDAVDGHALPGINVSAQDASVACCQFLGGATTDNLGTYSMIVPAGSSAKVEFNVFNPAPGRYGGQWYNNKPTFTDATRISAAADVSGIDAHLVTGFFVSGRVSDTTGNGLGGIQVVASDASLPCCVDLFHTTTSPAGDYQLLVTAGLFRIWFGDPANHYIAEFYNDKLDPNLADLLTVTGDTPGINAALAPSPQNGPPVFTAVSVGGNVASVTFNKPVCRSSFWTASSWEVVVNGVVGTYEDLGDTIPLCTAPADNGVTNASLILGAPVTSGSPVDVTLSAGGGLSIRDAAGNFASGPQTRTATAGSPETIPPTIVSATGALGSTTFTLTFSEPVFCSIFSFNGEDIVISDNDPATTTDPLAIAPGFDPCGTTQLTADTSFSILLNTFLLPNTTYTVTLTPEPSEIRDLALNNLANPSSAMFSTGAPDLTPPTVTDSRLLNNVASTDFAEVGDSFSMTFSERMNGSTTGTIDVQDQDGSTASFICASKAVCVWDTGVTTVTVTLVAVTPSSGGTTPGLQIPATITGLNGFADTAGNAPDLAGSADLLIN